MAEAIALRGALVLLGLLLASGAAGAASTLALRTHEPAALAGMLEVRMEGASLLVQDDGAPARRALDVLHGHVTVWTWRVAHADAALVDWSLQAEDARREDFDMGTARLVVETGGAPFHLSVRMSGDGVASVRGPIDAEAVPYVIARVGEDPVIDAPGLAREAEDVAWAYAAGWVLAGDALAPPHNDASPIPEDAVARLEGPARLKIEHGRVELMTRDGTRIERELGVVASDATGETRRRLVFEGTLAPSVFPVEGVWALGAPRATWTLDGSARFAHATGVATVDGEARAFEDADVVAEGIMTIAPEPPAGARDPARYDGRGAMRIAVDGEALAAAARAPALGAALAPAAGIVVALASLGALAWRFAAPFYTRLAPADVLAHPRRQAILDAVARTPGARQRDLQHALGLAWGAFAFHLRILVRAGHLRLERHGAYTLVLPLAARADAPLIAHPVARAVWQAIPADGTSVPFVAMRERLGYSRQRVNHHLQALEARGLVRVEHGADGARRVARAAQTRAPMTT